MANKTGKITIQCMYEIDIEDISKECILLKMFEYNRPIFDFNLGKSHVIIYYLQIFTFDLKPFVFISEMQGRCT